MSLRPEATPPDRRHWIRHHAAGLASATLGVLAVGAAALVVLSRDGSLTDAPDPRLTVPFLIATLACAIAAFARREGVYALPAAGIALAACALVLGWALIVALVAAVAIAVILILAQLF